MENGQNEYYINAFMYMNTNNGISIMSVYYTTFLLLINQYVNKCIELNRLLNGVLKPKN